MSIWGTKRFTSFDKDDPDDEEDLDSEVDYDEEKDLDDDALNPDIYGYFDEDLDFQESGFRLDSYLDDEDDL